MANFNFNKVIIGGRITAEPELKQTTSGVPVLTFSVAVNRRVTKNTEQKADFINCRAWRERAEFISRYFHKGSSISIVGTLQQKNWVDPKGAKHSAHEVVVEEVNFVDSMTETKEEPHYFEQVPDDRDLPF